MSAIRANAASKGKGLQASGVANSSQSGPDESLPVTTPQDGGAQGVATGTVRPKGGAAGAPAAQSVGTVGNARPNPSQPKPDKKKAKFDLRGALRGGSPPQATFSDIASNASASSGPGPIGGEDYRRALSKQESKEKDHAAQTRKVAFEYNMGNSMWVLFSVKGTFWPHVLRTHELYIFPLVHTGLIIRQSFWLQEKYDEDDDGDPPMFWGSNTVMLPWAALGMLTPLMIFALVSFLGQCYARFMAFFYACQRMETSIQDMAILMLTHATLHRYRWNVVRYMTAAAMVMYARVTDLGTVNTKGERCKPRVDFLDWERLLVPERLWHHDEKMTTERWEDVMGWPDSGIQGLEAAAELTRELHASFGTSTKNPERRHKCPALLRPHEVDELREYPDQMMSLVLLTWTAQTIKELEVKGELKGPSFGQAQGSILKLRGASQKICNLLNLPVPLPYYHTLCVLQNVCFALYSYALLAMGSFLTPLILVLVVIVTVGLREVAVAFSNPFGRDDVDFPIDRWVSQVASCKSSPPRSST